MSCRVRDNGGRFSSPAKGPVRVTGKPTGEDVRKLTERSVSRVREKKANG